MLLKIRLSSPRMVWFSFFWLTSLLFAPSLVWAQSDVTPQSPPAAPRANAIARATTPALDRAYRLGPGDVLDIRIFGRAELSKNEARVDDQGRIRMPFLGEITAACLTEAQVVQIITEGYKKYLRDPQVDVMVKQYNSQPVAIIGAVATPARYQLQRRMRLLELLTHAGGPSASAGNTIHIIHSSERDFCKTLEDKDREVSKESSSNEPAMPVLVSYKLRDLMAGDASANVYVEPGDIISIPSADQVFVTGGVVRPAPIPLVGKLTLTQAIYMSGGFLSGMANKKQVRLIRQEPGTDRREVKVYNVEDIEKRRMEDVTLQANDVIEVPGNRSIGRSILSIFTPTLTQLPIQVIRPY